MASVGVSGEQFLRNLVQKGKNAAVDNTAAVDTQGTGGDGTRYLLRRGDVLGRRQLFFIQYNLRKNAGNSCKAVILSHHGVHMGDDVAKQTVCEYEFRH